MTVGVTKHIIVDGSNIATEGRSVPSLAQLHEAVTAFMKEYPTAKVTVVVDATFGHRIAKKEVAEFNKAIEHNELVAPPAGAIGRGDAFILAIAEKAKATILSNDSFQEFHGKYKWLFDEGRLIGGKPVPYCLARIPQGGEVRGNLAAGGKGVAQALSDRDREIAQAIGPTLFARGLLLVGLDVIGDCLTEVNVTSPTCFQEITDQTGCDVAQLFLQALEQACA